MNASRSQPTYQDLLDAATAPGQLVEPLPEGRVRCTACAHRCTLAPGKRGVCKVRFNDAGTLRVPFGYAAGVQSDPVEKKPFFHVLPGSNALTFGMLGCDLHCSYCQNWITSQTLRDEQAVAPFSRVTAAELSAAALRTGARIVVSSYNEPLITAEWAHAVFTEAKDKKLFTGFVSNGNATAEVLDFIRPVTDCFKVDLKTMNEDNYRSLGGLLKHVLWTIGEVHRRGFWVEIVTLIVPGWNDSKEELQSMARFIAGISPDIPWHVTAFHKDYLMEGPPDTTPDMLMRAARIGAAEGLHFVYAGNLPGAVDGWEATRCSGCGKTLIDRLGYTITEYNLTPGGDCPSCGRTLPGIWPRSASDVPVGSGRNRPLRISL